MSNNAVGKGAAAPASLAGPRWRVLDASQLSAHEGLREPIKGVISGGVGMIFGDSNTGKTLVAVDMAWHLAIGQPWAGRKTDLLPVIYVATEAARSIERRFIAAQAARGAPIPAGMLALVDGAVSFRNSADIDRLIELARRMGHSGVLFGDTFANMCDGADENSVGEMAPVLANAARFERETGWTVVFVHHANKSGQYRGSSSIRARLDFVIEIRASESGEIKAISDKLRDATKGPICSMKISTVEIGQDGYGDPLSTPLATVVTTGPSAITALPRKAGREVMLLDVFRQLLAESSGAPVEEKTLRARFSAALGLGVAEAARRKAFDRARKMLEQAGEVVVHGGQWQRSAAPLGQLDRTLNTGHVPPVLPAAHSGQTGQDGAPLGARPCPDVPEPLPSAGERHDDHFQLSSVNLSGVQDAVYH
jgi:hypothetical protein